MKSGLILLSLLFSVSAAAQIRIQHEYIISVSDECVQMDKRYAFVTMTCIVDLNFKDDHTNTRLKVKTRKRRSLERCEDKRADFEADISTKEEVLDGVNKDLPKKSPIEDLPTCFKEDQ